MGSIFWVGILPLFIFVLIDSFMGIKAGLISAIVVALAEAGYTIYTFGELDVVTISSLILVLVLSTLAFIKKNATLFKFQPVILSVAFGVILLVTYFAGYPLLSNMLIKYQNAFPAEIQERISNQPIIIDIFKISSHYLGYCFLAHGIVTAWAALKLSNWWWIVIRTAGFYFFMAIGVFLATNSLR